MAEVKPSHVYDLLHPSPIPLEDMAAISIAIELWRHEINEYRKHGSLNFLYLEKKISLDNITPNLPSTLLNLVEMYSEIVRPSIEDWLYYHYLHGIFEDMERSADLYYYNIDFIDRDRVLGNFDDFVGDFDGRIDRVKTAKRVLLCDGFNKLEKFKVSCHNCFEEEVVNLWPSVSSRININESDDNADPFLYYWVRRLRYGIRDPNAVFKMLKKMNKIPTNFNDLIDAEFKENELSRHEVFYPICVEFLNEAQFQKIYAFLKFCCDKEEDRKEIMSTLLYEELLGIIAPYRMDSHHRERNVEMIRKHVREIRSFDKFILCAIDDKEKIIKFKNDLSTNITEIANMWSYLLFSTEFHELMLFVDTIVLSEEISVNLKRCYFPSKLHNNFTEDRALFLWDTFNGDKVTNFLKWCFGGDVEKIDEFKSTLPIDEIVRDFANEILAADAASFSGYPPHELHNFIEWYFANNPSGLAEFKTRLADVFEDIAGL